jgi:Uma2 family endonuclease
MPVISTTKMTAKQFLMLGEDPPGVKLELVNGEIAVSPSPVPDHAFAIFQLATILNTYILECELGQLMGDIDTIFGEHDVRRPDIFFFSSSRLHFIGETAIHGPPDLAVEVISPSSGTIDRRDKFALYAAGKVKHYWIVDPRQRTIEAFTLRGKKYVGRVRGSGSDVVRLPPFPKLDIPLAKLWRIKKSR